MITLQQIVEAGLSENFHYAHCRKLGQLAPLRIFRIHGELKSPEDIYITEMNRRGLKIGDIKMDCLDAQLGWDQRFPGEFVNQC